MDKKISSRDDAKEMVKRILERRGIENVTSWKIHGPSSGDQPKGDYYVVHVTGCDDPLRNASFRVYESGEFETLDWIENRPLATAIRSGETELATSE